MPISRRTLVLSTIALLALGMAALVIIVVTNIWLVQRTQTFVTEVSQLRRLRASAVDLRSLVQDVETGQRGYLLSGEASYLTPYDNARAALDAQISRFETNAQVDVFAASRTPELIDIIRAKLVEVQQTIELMQQGEVQRARDLFETDRGRELMDRARVLFKDIITETEAQLGRLGEAQANSASALWWVSVLGGLVVIVVTLAGLATILAYLRQLAEARREVEALNASLEERVRERTAELGRANDEIQRFAYIVTHDLRAPLVNIMGFTAELEQGVKTVQDFIGKEGHDTQDPGYQEAQLAASEDLPEALNFIRSSTRKMDGLINAILKLSREGRRTLKPERIDLAAMLNAASNAVAHQVAEANGEVNIDVKVPNLVTDRLSVEQIIGNLLDNAVKYRRKNVPLRIDINVRREPGGLVAISVEDNGRGIDKQDHERVFELFRRSGHQDQPGEGIGLAHVRAMARNLGGDISLNSTFGQGSVFTLSLPADGRNHLRSVPA